MKMITDIETVHSSVELAFTGDRARRSEAYAAGGRFCRAARMLVSGRLWFQISYVRSGEPSVTSFSDAADVTAEDHRWIFRSCAEAAELPCERPSGLFAGGRKVYALLPARGKGGGDRGYADTDLTDEGFAEASEMLMGSGAVIRMYAGVDTDGSMRCALFLSLEESMALRLRAALSDALPSAVFEEVTPDDPDPAERRLPPSAVRDAIGGFTYELMAKAEALRREEPGKEPDVPRAVHGGHTPLEELGLSVRAYNCLKRAGVCSVEQLRAMSAGDLIRIRNLGTKCADEILRKLGGARSPERRQTRVENGMEALDGMVGLDEIKEQVRRIAAFARMRHAMAESGEKDVPVVLNMEFIGNPGTAKTTAARALAGILGDMGILSSPEPLEVGRADLVAEYVGQTAVKVRDVFERAKGRLLFIDEAYSLADGRGGYGDEALSAIVQEMENSPGDPVVIFAGYPDEMDRLFSRNPGLRSRVPFTVRFPDYTAEEMARITELEARKRGFGVSEEGRRRILSICTEAQGRRGTGNGRFCRNLAESAILRYAARACGDGDAFPEGERLLTEKDFTAPALPRKERRTAPIGFRA